MSVSVKVKINTLGIQKKLNKLLKDKGTLTACHNLLFKMCDPYVPFDTGTLSQSVEVTDKYVRYLQPYAHYMYTGIVYGPNIPIIENGVVVGFFSRPGVKKTPTGNYINYDKTHHPLATHHWDEAMMNVQGSEFTSQIQAILEERAKHI